MATAERLEPRGRAAAILGILDAAAALDPDERRRVARIGLATGQARVRRAALDHVCDLDGADAAIRRAQSDRDATVRTWRPRSDTPYEVLSLL